MAGVELSENRQGPCHVCAMPWQVRQCEITELILVLALCNIYTIYSTDTPTYHTVPSLPYTCYSDYGCFVMAPIQPTDIWPHKCMLILHLWLCDIEVHDPNRLHHYQSAWPHYQCMWPHYQSPSSHYQSP